MRVLFLIALLCLTGCSVVIHKDAVVGGTSLKIHCAQGYRIWVKEDQEGDMFNQSETRCVRIPTEAQ